MSEFGELVRGNGLQKSDFVEDGVGCIHYGQIYTFYGTSTKTTKSFVTEQTASKLRKVYPTDLIITNTSENIEDVCKTVAWLGEEEIVTGGHATIFRHKQNPKYLCYYMQTEHFFKDKKKFAKGAKVSNSVIMPFAKIEADAVVEKAIVAQNSKIEATAQVGSDDGTIVVIPEGETVRPMVVSDATENVNVG